MNVIAVYMGLYWFRRGIGRLKHTGRMTALRFNKQLNDNKIIQFPVAKVRNTRVSMRIAA